MLKTKKNKTIIIGKSGTGKSNRALNLALKKKGTTIVYNGCIDKSYYEEKFTDKALDDIYKESTGILRSINRIAEKCLMYAFQQNKRLIDEHMVNYVIEHEMLKGGV